ncbi:MAG: SagB/ThcOx family dehydrogenase [Candidatus Omnitrophica bacterium]|nr:SagB/ThcOx family dehydrogenase [Candidatus Omnitrophota bacterium]
MIVNLPVPSGKGDVSLEEAISERRSIRKYSDKKLAEHNIGQILWAAQGVTKVVGRYGLRASPSAGATYPLEIYLLTDEKVSRYLPEGHRLEHVMLKDQRGEIAAACYGQGFIEFAPAVIVIVADYSRTTDRYGERGKRYVLQETGHVAQNIHLQARALGMGSVPIGAFDDDVIKKILLLPQKQEPLYVVPIGYPE